MTVGDYFESDFIETPENVTLERRLAGIGSRFLAGFLDCLLLVAILIGLSFIMLIFFLVDSFSAFDPMGDSGGGGAALAWVQAIMILVTFAVTWGYFAFFELRTNGQSPGKKVMKIRVVKLDGGAITFTDVAIRSLLRIVDFLPVGYGFGGVVMFITKRTQRLGDLASGTVVVDESVADYSSVSRNKNYAASVPSPDQVRAETADADGLTPREFEILSSYWNRRNELTFESRNSLLPKLLMPILTRLGQQPYNTSLAVLETYLSGLLFKAQMPPEPPASLRATKPFINDNSGEGRRL